MDCELSEKFEVTVGMHKGSELSPFLFVVVVVVDVGHIIGTNWCVRCVSLC